MVSGARGRGRSPFHSRRWDRAARAAHHRDSSFVEACDRCGYWIAHRHGRPPVGRRHRRLAWHTRHAGKFADTPDSGCAVWACSDGDALRAAGARCTAYRHPDHRRCRLATWACGVSRRRGRSAPGRTNLSSTGHRGSLSTGDDHRHLRVLFSRAVRLGRHARGSGRAGWAHAE